MLFSLHLCSFNIIQLNPATNTDIAENTHIYDNISYSLYTILSNLFK